MRVSKTLPLCLDFQIKTTSAQNLKNITDTYASKDYVNNMIDEIPIDTTLAQSGQAADAKAVGDKFASLVGDTSVAIQIDNAVAQKSQVQIITWEADD